MPRTAVKVAPEPADNLAMGRRARAFRARQSGDSGFTLVELSVAAVIFGLLSAIAVGGLWSLQRANAEKGAHREVMSAMRNAQSRAVSEATTFCVDFGTAATSTQFNVYRVPGAGSGALSPTFACTSGTKVSGPNRLPQRTALNGIAFNQRNGQTTRYVLFYPRGAASPGALTVTRDGSTKTYSVVIDALTGRVADPNGS